MIEAIQFVEAAKRRGFRRYAGVPCSYLTPFINYVMQDPSLDYLSAANEGDAVAITAGAVLGGERGVTMMQNSGLGNAVSPLTSLTWTFRLPQLLIVTWRGEPGRHDEPQHALMGPITPAMLHTMEIPWEPFPDDAAAIDAVLDRACAHMDATGRPYALLMSQGSVAPFALREAGDVGEAAARLPAAEARHPAAEAPRPAAEARHPAAEARRASESIRRPTRGEVLQRVVASTPVANTVVIATTGFTGRELYALDDRPNQLYVVGSMGCASALALGLARARADWRVVVVDGDGAALMRMSLFATIGAYGPPNLVHLVLDNGAHESTGGQATVSSGVSFAGVAAACGYTLALEGDDLALVDLLFNEPAPAGPRFAAIRTRLGVPEALPRPKVTPEQVRQRLSDHMGRAARTISGLEPREIG